MAALPLIEKEVVDTYQWLSNGEFLELVTLSELTPGPIGVLCHFYRLRGSRSMGFGFLL